MFTDRMAHRTGKIVAFAALGLLVGALPAIDSLFTQRISIRGLPVVLATYALGLGLWFWLLTSTLERLRGWAGDWIVVAVAGTLTIASVLTAGSIAKWQAVYVAGACGDWLVWSKLAIVGYPMIAAIMIAVLTVLRCVRRWRTATLA